jgi:hypothetical protein
MSSRTRVARLTKDTPAETVCLSGYERANGLGNTRQLPGVLSPQQLGGDLWSLADRVRRLSPSSRDPERFHIEKSEIERKLRMLAEGAAR